MQLQVTAQPFALYSVIITPPLYIFCPKHHSPLIKSRIGCCLLRLSLEICKIFQVACLVSHACDVPGQQMKKWMSGDNVYDLSSCNTNMLLDRSKEKMFNFKCRLPMLDFMLHASVCLVAQDLLGSEHHSFIALRLQPESTSSVP